MGAVIVGSFRAISSIAVANNTLYVVLTLNDTEFTSNELKMMFIREIMRNENSNKWEIYRSDNLGESWQKITPKNRSLLSMLPGSNLLGGEVLAFGETVLAFGLVNAYRSKDKGETWTDLGVNIDSAGGRHSSSLAVNEETFIRESFYKLKRTTDGGETWQPFMKGIVGNQLNCLVSYEDRLYAHSGFEFFQSSDNGQNWSNVFDEVGNKRFFLFPYLLVVDDTLYAVSRDADSRLRIASLSANKNMLLPIDGLPPISGFSPNKNNINETEIGDVSYFANESAETEALSEQARKLKTMLGVVTIGGIAVTGNTFYVERDGRLYKSYVGAVEWTDTGFNTGEDFSFSRGSLAASGETVYVSKEDGHLFKSIDAGSNWIDITTDLPLRYKFIREIVFADSLVYVVTDKGVMSSLTGEEWTVLTDNTDSTIEIVSLAVEGTNIFGVNNSGIYHLDEQEKWEELTSDVPEQVSKLVIHEDRFYVATKSRGMFNIPIDMESK